MNLQNRRTSIILIGFLIGYFLVAPKPAQAVIPPDFIFNIGTQVANFFVVIAVFLAAILSTSWHFFKFQISKIKNKPILFCSILAVLIAFIGVSVYAYADYLQKAKYKKWLIESKQYQATVVSSTSPITEIPIEPTFTESTTTESSLPPVESKLPTPLAISNSEFKNILESAATDYIVLDARENIEYENGHFPGSVHIRFADLKAGDWAQLSNDNRIFVLCWSGIRGKEVAEFLRSHTIEASYLENGANGWVEFGGKWIGNITFAQRFSEKRYELVFTTSELKKKMAEGAFLVDSREPARFKQKHIPGSINIPLMYTPTEKIENVFATVPPGAAIITICDTYVNCFDAKLTGVELEKRGHEFLGRYNKPWEYAQ